MASYTVDINDKRLTSVNAERDAELTDHEKQWGGIIEGADKYYDDQAAELDRYKDEQTELQKQQTDLAIERIENAQKQTHKDYIKEQSGAYVDWQKASDKYGVNAEKTAAQGLAGTGYSESLQVSMYNTYQNRVATARESYQKAVTEYDLAIKDAQLQNSTALAQIAHDTLMKKLELSLQGFQYKNTLLLQKMAEQREIKNTYYTKWRDVYNQIHNENVLAEQARQHDESLKAQKEQAAASLALQREQFEWQKKQAEEAKIAKSVNNSRVGGSKGGSVGSGSSKTTKQKQTVQEKKMAQQDNKGNKTPQLKTYKEAAAYLNSKGIKGDGGLMTESEWSRRKRSGSNRAATAASSYSEYLREYCYWAVSNR